MNFKNVQTLVQLRFHFAISFYNFEYFMKLSNKN